MMAPRHEDEDSTAVVHSADSGSPLIMSACYERSFSFDSVELTAPNQRKSVLASALTSMTPSLKDSFQQLAEHGSQMLEEMNSTFGDSSRSPTMSAARLSLAWDFLHMLEEAQILLEGVENNGVMVTPWRLSLARVRADSYLHLIHSVLNSPQKDSVDRSLLAVVDPVIAGSSEQKTTGDLPIRISSWRNPSLAFDAELGDSVQYLRKAAPPKKGEFDYQLPLKLQVKAIAEIFAQDIETGSVGKYEPCNIHVEKCRHEAKSIGWMSGTVGEAVVKIRISPIATSKPAAEGDTSEDKEKVLRVEEARVVQINAFPPEPKGTVDIYTSSLNGSRDAVVTLRFNTSKTRADEIPEIIIELMVGAN